MPGRARGRMFDIRPEHDDEDPAGGTGSYPGYPGYGDEADDPYGDDGPPARNGAPRDGADPDAAVRNGSGRNGAGRNGADRNGADPDGAVRSESGRNGAGRNGAGRNGAGRNGAGRNGAAAGGARRSGARGAEAATTAVRAVPGSADRHPAEEPDGRVAPDGRWDDDEPPLLSHRSDEPAYARDHTPQGFDGGDPDDPAWGRRDDHRGPGDEPDDHHEDDHHGDDEYDEDEYDDDEYGVGDAPLSVPPPGSGGRPLGPADVEELDPSMTDALARVDLGSVQVPVPYGAEMKLEPSGGERPQAVHLLLPEGRIAVSALAAPRSSGLWPDLAAEIEASLRKGGARVRNARGDWGRELHARTENAASVFVGCDGPRWMVYGVATASLDTVEALDVELRRVLRGIIVVRGKSPYPPRTVLPLELPERLREQQPDAAPPKASITVSVPVPTPAADDATAAPSPGGTGATPRGTGATPRVAPAAAGTTGATPRDPDGPPRRNGARPEPAGPPQAPPRRPAEPPTRSLPQVRRPAARAAGPDEADVERTAVAGAPLRARTEEPVERTAATPVAPRRDGPAADDPARDDGVHRHPDRAIRAGRARPGRPDRPARTARDAAEGTAHTERGALARRHPAPAAAPPHRTAGEYPVEHEPVPPPVRRDPAVTALSAADLLVEAAADPALRDRSTGRTGRPAGRSAERPARDDVLRTGREPAAGPEPRPRPDPVGPPAEPPRPHRPAAIEDIPLADVPLMEATLDRRPEPDRPVADPLPRRRRRDPDAASAGPDPTPADDDGWLSAEIAASRRGGRHGAGTGTGWSVADILASAATGDAPRGGARASRRAAPAGPAPGPDGDDLFRSAGEDRTGGRGGDGHPVTGLADYRRSRAAGRDVDRAVGDPVDGAAGPDDRGPGTGRAVGDPWSGRRGGDADPRDLGRHRRD